MFENSSSWQRYKQHSGPALRAHLGYAAHIEEHPEEDRRVLRIAVIAALLFHVGLFLVNLPDLMSEPKRVGSPAQVFLLKPVRFSPPPPRAPKQEIPKQREKRRVIPVPDPTPDEPEPIRIEEFEVPDVAPEEVMGLFGIPDAPPADGRSRFGAVPVTGNIMPPVKIHAPQPQYTEDARRARVQGVVILEATIDEQGNVVNVRVLKGLPMGLAESAVETARQWRFKPATENGRPVAVFFNLLVNFSLQ